jgi:hypothetical protein
LWCCKGRRIKKDSLRGEEFECRENQERKNKQRKNEGRIIKLGSNGRYVNGNERADEPTPLTKT